MPSPVIAPLWRRLPFTWRFLLILAVTGLLIAAVPLILASRETRTSAEQRAGDRVGIAAQLIDAQHQSISAYADGIAAQLGSGNTMVQTTVLKSQLAADSSAAPQDVLGVVDATGTIAARNGAALAASDDVLQHTVTLLQQTGSAPTAPGTDGAGHLVLVATAPIAHSTARVFIARPLVAPILDGVVLLHGGKLAADGTIAGSSFVAGASAPTDVNTVAQALGDPQVVSVGGQSTAVAATAIGGGFVAVATAPLTDTGSLGVPEMVLGALILVAMVFIVSIVQADLQRPLRRLDRAVGALGRGDLDFPIPDVPTTDEIGRLAKNFEVMRLQLRSMLRITRARAAIATDLNAPQPLQIALEKVCVELRDATDAAGALIAVKGSDMTDAFVVGTGGAAWTDLDVEALLGGDGPIGTAFRADSSEATTVSAPAGCYEANNGLTRICVAPLRIGSNRHGVVAVVVPDPESTPDPGLVTATADQVALALERYTFLTVVQRQASIDDLTGLFNHRFLIDHLDQQVALAERLGAPLAVLMLDIDHFKVLNDSHGHHAGDIALQAFAETLSGSVRRSDVAARYGGEEFAVIMPNTDRDDAAQVAEKIRQAVADRDVQIDLHGPKLRITVSIGVASYPADTKVAEDLLQRADEGLYLAKHQGRNQVALAPGPQATETPATEKKKKVPVKDGNLQDVDVR